MTHKERFVLVTGGTGGIGSAVCEQLAEMNYRPIVGYSSRPSEAESSARSLQGLALSLNLADDKNIDKAIHELQTLPGRCMGIAHCASPPPKLGPFSRITSEEHEWFWRVNVVGVHRLLSGMVKACFKPFREGTVVAVTSSGMGSDLGSSMPGLGAYTFSKFGLYGVLTLLASEHKWLKVHEVRPGFTRTKMLEVFDPRFVEQLSAQGLIASASDVAKQVVTYF